MMSYKRMLLSAVIMATCLLNAADQNKTEIVELCKKELQQSSSLIMREMSPSTTFIRNLSAHLRGNQSITTINLNYSAIGDDNIKLLLSVFQTLDQLTNLHLYRTGLTDVGIVALCNAFLVKKPIALTALDLCENPYDLEGIKKIQELEQAHNTLKIKRNVPQNVLEQLCE